MDYSEDASGSGDGTAVMGDDDAHDGGDDDDGAGGAVMECRGDHGDDDDDGDAPALAESSSFHKHPWNKRRDGEFKK